VAAVLEGDPAWLVVPSLDWSASDVRDRLNTGTELMACGV
jgi:hypothetical protein